MMMLAGFQTITTYTSLTVHGLIATIKHIVFQLFAMQLAAVLSAICLPIMALDAVLRILGFSPLIKVRSCQQLGDGIVVLHRL